MTTRSVSFAVCVILAAGILCYLRDPSWLGEHTTGLRAWQVAADGRRYRWSGGHASFFVPSTAREVDLPVATTFDRAGDIPMTVTVTIDDVRASRALLTDAGWRTMTLTLPPPGSRRVRRIDVRTNVTRPDNHGVMVGAAVIR